MKNLLFVALLLVNLLSFGQKNALELQKSQESIDTYGDVYFKFSFENIADVEILPNYISIDSKTMQHENVVYAYIHKSKYTEFLQLNIPFEVVPKTNETKALTMATTVGEMANWDRYPTYSVYQQMMQDFETNYPALCRLESIGTSQNGRDLSVLKITDNPDDDENEPEFFYTSTMHGDETTGAILTLRLIDYLLSNYGSDSRVDNLVNNLEIWINPFANPDGTYNGGNHTVSGATRYANNGVDLNRNYPGPFENHPDGYSWAQETIDMMAFADDHNIVLSANMHGGAEVVNYPWDSWDSQTGSYPNPPTGVNRLHPDDDWWQLVSYEYADTANYFSGVYNWVTNSNEEVVFGGDWYSVGGSRQDYMTYFKEGREFTLELSDTKLLGSQHLQTYWNYNYESLLLYLEQAAYGIHGIITDSVTGNPIEAKVEITGHDDDISFVHSQLPVGDYHRLIYEGTYNVTYSKTGYHSQTIATNVTNYNTIVQDVALVPLGAEVNDAILSNAIILSPNPTDAGNTYLSFTGSFVHVNIVVYDHLGRAVFSEYLDTINAGQRHEMDLNASLASGIYLIKIGTSRGIAVKRLIKN